MFQKTKIFYYCLLPSFHQSKIMMKWAWRFENCILPVKKWKNSIKVGIGQFNAATIGPCMFQNASNHSIILYMMQFCNGKWVYWLPTTFKHFDLSACLKKIFIFTWALALAKIIFHVSCESDPLQRSQVINSSGMVIGLSHHHHHQLIISCFFNNINDFKIRFLLFVFFL